MDVAGEGDRSVESGPGLGPGEVSHVDVSAAILDHDLATPPRPVEADGPPSPDDHPTTSRSFGEPSGLPDPSIGVPPGSETALHEGAPTPVDNDVDSNLSAGPITHEVATQAVGENHVEEQALTAPGTVVSRETHGADHGDGMGPLEDEHAVAENVRRRIQLTGRPFPKPVQPRVMTVANQKGGVGKTTTTVNIAAAMAQAGLRILVIDLDPQGNASTALGIDHHAEVPSIYDVLVEGVPLLDVVQPCTTVEGLFCAPATIDLAGAEIELVSLVARETRLQKAIRAATETGHDYDYVLIDCPPSLGLLTVNAMVAASEVFIPIQCEYYALEGLSQLLKNIELVKAHLNPDLHVSTILLTMYDGRTRLSAQVAEEVREHFPAEVLRTTVPRSVRVSEAPSFGETVMTYDPTSSGALAYLEAAGEIADRGAAGNI
ncbi:MAG TPA: AAA family ATPase [Intrasporangium sp.]|nr:AAA family ATPase [Intrasporangium sp.]